MNYSDFKCTMCGNCCRIPGYVRVDEKDIEKIAKFMKLTITEFIEKYTILTNDRKSLSLKETSDFSCIFYSSKIGCKINSVKPKQCINFPYSWRYDDLTKICTWAKNKAHYDNKNDKKEI